MSEKILSSLIHILALLSRTRRGADYIVEKNMVISFLQKQYSSDVVKKYTTHFEKIYNSVTAEAQNRETESPEAILGEIDKISMGIYNYLSFRQRIYILVSLLEFSKYLKNYLEPQDTLERYYDYVKRISVNLKVDKATFINCKGFCLDKYHLVPDKNSLLIISNKKLSYASRINSLINKEIEGLLYVLKFEQEFFLLKYEGEKTLYVDNNILKKNSVYFFSNSSFIKDKNNYILFYNEIDKAYIKSEPWQKLIYTAINIEFRYKNSNNGIKPFSFQSESNELVGIIGSSGSGKTTLLNLLNGNLKLHGGEIKINGTPLNETLLSSGIIGYVPQDDLLINELTVFENLFFSARLSKNWGSDAVLREKVENVLEIFQLYEFKDIKVGSVLKKTISGGQRKRINIAIELIREPTILFVDEPTSGLSSTDAFNIIHLLKQQVQRHKLVFVNIHQPSNDVFYLFDKMIIIDKGGYPVYFGRPGDALEYFRTTIHRIQTISSGKYQSEQEEILSIVEEKRVNEFGNTTNERLVPPEKWYRLYKGSYKLGSVAKETPGALPVNTAIIPGSFTQFKAFLIRNIKTKISDRQYLIMALSISPVLAFVLSFLCKQYTWDKAGNKLYIFNQNDNMASFYFMSVIVAVFVGLIVSAEEVHRDKKLFIREQFLNLSKLSYYTSKIFFLLFFSFLQTGAFALISTLILEIPSNLVVYWAALFFISLLSNVIGLIISKLFDSLIAIYIAIPLILVPQILLSGVVVKYEKLHPAVTSQEYVPLIGDLMPTRWGYEILIVNQFKNNAYQEKLFEIEKKESNLTYSAFILLPELEKMIEQDAAQDKWGSGSNTEIVLKELKKYPSFEKGLFTSSDKGARTVSTKEVGKLLRYIDQLQRKITQKLNKVMQDKDFIVKNTNLTYPGIKEENCNNSITDLVKDRNAVRTFKIIDNRIIRLYEPVFNPPQHTLGRSLFFSSAKKIGNLEVGTITFNLLVLSFMILIGGGILVFEVPDKIRKLLNI